MVEVGQVSVDFKGVRIPPGKQSQLYADTCEAGQPARSYTIDNPHGSRQCNDTQPSEDHRLRVVHAGVHEERDDECQQQVSHYHPFVCHESLYGMLF